jgi:hypothetical protein
MVSFTEIDLRVSDWLLNKYGITRAQLMTQVTKLDLLSSPEMKDFHSLLTNRHKPETGILSNLLLDKIRSEII